MSIAPSELSASDTSAKGEGWEWEGGVNGDSGEAEGEGGCRHRDVGAFGWLSAP